MGRQIQIQVPYKYYLNTVKILYQCDTISLQILYKYNTNTIQKTIQAAEWGGKYKLRYVRNSFIHIYLSSISIVINTNVIVSSCIVSVKVYEKYLFWFIIFWVEFQKQTWKQHFCSGLALTWKWRMVRKTAGLEPENLDHHLSLEEPASVPGEGLSCDQS